MDYPGT